MTSTTTIEVTEEMKQKVVRFIKKNRFITNRQCRELLGLGYDQVITLFNRMVESGELFRLTLIALHSVLKEYRILPKKSLGNHG